MVVAIWARNGRRVNPRPITKLNLHHMEATQVLSNERHKALLRVGRGACDRYLFAGREAAGLRAGCFSDSAVLVDFEARKRGLMTHPGAVPNIFFVTL